MNVQDAKERVWSNAEHYKEMEDAHNGGFQDGYRIAWREAYIMGFKDGFESKKETIMDRLEYENQQPNTVALIKSGLLKV